MISKVDDDSYRWKKSGKHKWKVEKEKQKLMNKKSLNLYKTDGENPKNVDW